jgi:hypothetical protein
MPTANFAQLSQALEQRQIAVWNAKSARWQGIPVALSSLTIDPLSWESLSIDAKSVLDAFPYLLTWLQRKERSLLWQALFSRLSDSEKWAAMQNPKDTWGHATLRFDLYWHKTQWMVIEVNCTIPAMQAYSDMLMEAWQEATRVQILPRTSNSLDLWNSLASLYYANGGLAKKPVVLILHRSGDSQLAELEYHQHQWSSFADVLCATPEVCRVDHDGIYVGNRKIDLVYRHVFASVLESYPEWVPLLKKNRTFHIYNPISAHYEVKGFLALLSEVASDAALSAEVGLNPVHIRGINRRVPWTRLIHSYSNGLLNSPSDVTEDYFTSDIEDLVVKNSVGYGGQSVFIGGEWFSERSQNRLQKLMNVTETVTPKSFFNWIVHTSSDTWIVQKRMEGHRFNSEIIGKDGVKSTVDGFADASIFLNTSSSSPPRCGGVSRFGDHAIVNIGAGGGLVPFLIG